MSPTRSRTIRTVSRTSVPGMLPIALKVGWVTARHYGSGRPGAGRPLPFGSLAFGSLRFRSLIGAHCTEESGLLPMPFIDLVTFVPLVSTKQAVIWTPRFQPDSGELFCDGMMSVRVVVPRYFWLIGLHFAYIAALFFARPG